MKEKVLDRTRTALEGVNLWLGASKREVRENGLDGVKESTRLLYTHLWRAYGMVRNYGEPIYESDWDVLVVLDACRADLMAEVESEYEFIDFDTTQSVGSCSPEWMEKNFVEEYADEIRRTAYITGNPYSATRLDPADFSLFDEVWKYAWEESIETVPPDPLTDRTINVARDGDHDRIIVHYMQPHHPFVPSPMGDGISPETGERTSFEGLEDVWTRLQRGELTREEVWEGYRENLEYVLESVERLVENVDGTVVITADHGNALGEYHMYGHPIFAPVWPLKDVPWCEYAATDSREYAPDGSVEELREAQFAGADSAREEKLAALGYL